MDWQTLLASPLAIAMASGLVGALGGWLAKRTEKAPDMQTAANAAVAEALDGYKDLIDALKAERAQYRAWNDNLKAEMGKTLKELQDIKAYVDQLLGLLREAGIPVPPRHRRRKQDDSA